MVRKSISKKLRFEVFKRDQFTCQYCGAHPPSAILHVDHIHPVAKGGDNDMDNLVTACESCNQGKAARTLADVPKSLQERAKEVIEREAQIKGYQAAIGAKKRRIEEEAEQVRDVYESFNPGYTLNDKAMVSVRMFVERLGAHAVSDAMEYAHSRARKNEEFRYFCGVCWAKIKESSNVL
jgi:hypothetical protein